MTFSADHFSFKICSCQLLWTTVEGKMIRGNTLQKKSSPVQYPRSINVTSFASGMPIKIVSDIATVVTAIECEYSTENRLFSEVYQPSTSQCCEENAFEKIDSSYTKGFSWVTAE
jgi:hypothetical protein